MRISCDKVVESTANQATPMNWPVNFYNTGNGKMMKTGCIYSNSLIFSPVCAYFVPPSASMMVLIVIAGIFHKLLRKKNQVWVG